jgi:S-adenosylmethionine:tRNA ribosyltransferase-isomerase
VTVGAAETPLPLDRFDYDLPAELIAQAPAEPRDAARMLQVGAEGLCDHRIADLPSLLAPGDLLVANDTRVIPARLIGRRGDLAVELLLHKRLAPGRWACLGRPAKRLKAGQTVVIAPDFAATVLGRDAEGMVEVDFACDDAALMAALERHGAVPIPPYIAGGQARARDRDDYQTTFAAVLGAVAAPTAGLHFTPDLLSRLEQAGVGLATVTLHVGVGTFLAVTATDVRQHRMHAETGQIDAATARRIADTRAAGGRIVAIGTTSLRLLETAARADGTVRPFAGETSLFVLPGFRFHAVDRLLTNFHLPRSTLLMLAMAFAGTARIEAAYAHAIRSGYRFYSYGDATLLDRGQ